MVFRAILICILLLSFMPWAQAQLLSIDYHKVIDILDIIKQRCPPQECLYLGIGRSPALFTTALRMQDGNQVIDLPLGSFRYVASAEHELPRQTFMLGRDKKEILWSHFDNYIPTELSRKRILIIDYSLSGGSVASTNEFLQLFFRDHRKVAVPEISSFIMTYDKPQVKYIDDLISYRNTPRVSIFNLGEKHKQIAEMMYHENFDKFARDPSFLITDFSSARDYRHRWVKDSNLENNRLLQNEFVNQVNASEKLRQRFPIGCAAQY